MEKALIESDKAYSNYFLMISNESRIVIVTLSKDFITEEDYKNFEKANKNYYDDIYKLIESSDKDEINRKLFYNEIEIPTFLGIEKTKKFLINELKKRNFYTIKKMLFFMNKKNDFLSEKEIFIMKISDNKCYTEDDFMIFFNKNFEFIGE